MVIGETETISYALPAMQSRLGRYVVLKHLASGGMADVLLGRAEGIEGFERHVVLKRIKPEHAKDARFIRMFLDEARVAANLHHQHVVQVYDIGESSGEYFIAMEYLHGEDVRTILSTASKMRQHVPLGCAMAMVSAAAAGLHYAHERRGPDKRPLGIVHRDISPSNILVGYDGSIKVVDFGIAKASARQETRSSSLKGKISYMSPEQCKGGEVDRRSDVYSLGVVLYELATTTRLFKGESDYLVMDQIVNGRVTLPQVRRPELPNELSAIIMRAISPDPERRYFTADELRVALDQFAAKASLTTSTSAISTYMRKMFGEKPEPWLDLESQDFDAFDEIGEPPATESAPGKSWTEMPGSEDFRRTTSSIPRQSGPVGVIAGSATSETSRSQVSRLTGSPTPTDAKRGWESQQPAAAPRGLSPTRVVMICAPVIVLLVIAIWRLAGTGNSTSPVVAATAPQPTQPAPAAAPMVTPLPEPPKPSPEATGSAEPEPAVKPEPAPAPRRNTPSPAASSPSIRRSSSGRDSREARDAREMKSAEPASPGIITKTDTPGLPSSSAGSAVPLQSPAVTPAPVTPLVPVPPPLPSPAPPPAAPLVTQTVAPTVLDANRTSGDKEIVPDETTQSEIGRSGMDSIGGTFKICLTEDGSINAVTLLKSTGFPAYDNKIQNTIRKNWRYRPIMVSGKPTPVCTAVRFVYHQK